MLKSYNELSRWYSALEPESGTADPARPDTAEPAAEADDGPARYSQHPERTPSADQVAHEDRTPPHTDASHLDTAPASIPDAAVMDLAPFEAAKPVVPDVVVDHLVPDRTAGNYPTLDPAHTDPEPGRTVGYPERDFRTQGYPEKDFRTREYDDVDDDPYEPAPPPPAELAARRSEYTGGWSDWVAAPGPEDDYDAQLVQFPWPEAAADEYDEAHVLAPSGALRATRARNRSWLVLAVSVLVLVLAATGVLFLLFGRGPGDTAKHAAPPLHFTAGNLTAETATGECPTERTGSVVRSAEAGGTGSGPDAVLAFQYAYYVTRSGEQARAVVTPDAEVAPAAVIQRGIDSIPVGTTHCVRITTVADDRYTVEVTEFRPAGAPATYTKQSVRTALVGERTLITGIAAG
ncbi:hypothetical protein ACFXK0_16195 [Nocardia sp. NPDC059177]|uniref:hypothetical protein n=1 Tax=Nocardia sp. NPDC059177 TaxID=3346759 RepID=UPI0036B4A73F